MKRIIHAVAAIGIMLGIASCAPGAPVASGDESPATPTANTDQMWEPLSEQIQPEADNRVEFTGGLVLEMPGGSVAGEAEVVIVAQPGVSGGDVGTLVIPGIVYSIEIEGEDLQRLISITIPYDETLLPDDRSEGEIFAVFLNPGNVWERVYGAVDSSANTVTVMVTHASVWSWGYDKIVNFGRDVKDFFGINTVDDCPMDASEALNLVQRRRTELNDALRDVESELETLRGMVDDSVQLLIDTIISAINPFEEDDLVGYGLGYIDDALGEAWEDINDIIGLLEAGENLFEVSMQSGAVLASMTRAQMATNRLAKAEAIKYAFLYPEAQTAPGYLVDIYTQDKLCEIVDDADNDYPRGGTPEPECALWFVLAEVTYNGLGYSATHADKQTAIDTAIRECSQQNGVDCQVFRDPVCEAYE